MEIGPIFRALRQSKVAALLIALQVAFTMTVAVNSAGIVREQIRLVGEPTGVAEAELFHITTSGFAPNFNARAAVLDDLALIRQTPGVYAATVVNSVPLGGSGWTTGVQTEPGPEKPSHSAPVYMMDEHGLATFGVELIAGRDFTPEDIRERGPAVADWPDKAILSAALAQTLWPDVPAEQAAGRVFYVNGKPTTAIGIVALLQGYWAGNPNANQTMLVPDKLMQRSVQYFIRTDPGRVDELMPLIEEQLAQSNRDRIVRAPWSMLDTREKSYRENKAVAIILTAVMALLLIVNALGIVGLAAYSVRRRTKQIGTRRALGATKRNILRYFLTENALVTTIGVTLGTAMTIALNVFLVQAIPFVPKLDWWFVLLGVAAMCLVGLLAVLGPTRRASAVPPAVATRTV